MRYLPIVLSTVAVGCASRSLPLPRVLTPCVSDPRLIGTWTDTRMTQLGPAWVKLSLAPDCTSHVRIQLLWMRITESARYQVADDALIFERASGETRWPYRLSGERVELQEAPDEVQTYSRKYISPRQRAGAAKTTPMPAKVQIRRRNPSSVATSSIRRRCCATRPAHTQARAQDQ